MSEEPDNRLYFLRNQDEVAAGSTKYLDIEYEVVADAYIVGDLNYGPYNLTIWEFGITRNPIEPPGYSRKLCLRIRYAADSSEEVTRLEDSATRKGFYHGGGIPEELVTLASLFLRRRLRLGPVVRRGDKPMMYSERGTGWIDEPLILGRSNLEDLAQRFTLVERLHPDLHQKFMLAARLYHRALLLIEEEPDLAYLNLVSAIEVLCQDTDVGKVTLEDLGYNRLVELLARVEDEGLREELEQAILQKERLIKRRFVRFILDHVEESFWSDDERWPEGSRSEHGRIEPDQLERLLRKIYDQRSVTLHKGEPFPPQTFNAHGWREEIDTSISMRSGEREWRSTDYIPNPLFFERLVSHVLLTYITRNEEESPPGN